MTPNRDKTVKNENRSGKSFADRIKVSLKRRAATARNAIINLFSLLFISLFHKSSAVKSNQVMFMNFQNRYACHAKYICRELLKRCPDCTIIFVYSKNTASYLDEFPPQIKPVIRGSFRFYREMAASRIWVDNALNFLWNNMPKKKDQIYIQTWHGSLGFKKLRPTNKKFARKCLLCNSKTDYLISNSDFEDNVYRQTYWPDVPILRLGHARNDILFEKDPDRISDIDSQVRSELKIPYNVRLALYAPTFRDNRSTGAYNLDLQRLRASLARRLGGEWYILARFHLHTSTQSHETVEKSTRCSGVADATDYPDIQELMAVSDVGITDYSSWLCDYVLTRRPGFIYAPDYADYDGDRGLYYPLENSPFPVSLSNDALEENILGFDEQKYAADVEDFLKWTGCMDDGHASERIADKIAELLG